MKRVEHDVIDVLKVQANYQATTDKLAKDIVDNAITGYTAEEITPGLRTIVINYLTNASKKSKKAAEAISKNPTGSKEYSKAIKTQNEVRRSIEILKNDLGYWANFKVANFNGISNVSRLANFSKKEFSSRLAVDEDSVDETAIIRNGNLSFIFNGEETPVNDFSLPETANTADIAAKPLRNIIERQTNERSFNRVNVEGEVREIIDGLQKQTGSKGLKSLAGDYKFDNGTEHKTFIDWIAEFEGSLTTIFKENLDMSIKDNPKSSPDDIKKLNNDAYGVALSYIWTNENNESMKEKMVGYFVDVVENSYKLAKVVVDDTPQIEGKPKLSIEKLIEKYNKGI